MSYLLKPFDFSGIVGYPNFIPEDVIDNSPIFHNGGDACAHVKAFGQLIDDWYDPPIYEDALMQLFSWTLFRDMLVIGFFFMRIIRSRPYGTFCMTFWKDLGMIGMKFTMNWLMILWKNGRGRIFQI
jgi:hypothetical protein